MRVLDTRGRDDIDRRTIISSLSVAHIFQIIPPIHIHSITKTNFRINAPLQPHRQSRELLPVYGVVVHSLDPPTWFTGLEVPSASEPDSNPSASSSSGNPVSINGYKDKEAEVVVGTRSRRGARSSLSITHATMIQISCISDLDRGVFRIYRNNRLGGKLTV